MCWTRFVECCTFSWNWTSGPSNRNQELAANAPVVDPNAPMVDPNAPMVDDDCDTIVIKFFASLYTSLCTSLYTVNACTSMDSIYRSLFLRLARKNSRNCLDLKIIQCLSHDSMEALLVYLAETTTLQELRLQGDCLFKYRYQAPQLVKAVSLNICIGRVEMLRTDGSSGLSVKQQALVAAYLARNSNLRQLLRQDALDLELWPRILAVTRQIPRLTSCVLRAVLVLAQEVPYDQFCHENTNV
jgi:hypothetical protein